MTFTIIITPDADEDISFYRVHEQRIIIDAIRTYLTHEADVETKKRKRLRPNALTPWELRVDMYRIFYRVTNQHVTVAAVGHKVHNRLFIRGQEVVL